MTSYPHKIAVAPMMDWTDRHCRFFHRQLTRRALLHTEMITADAVIHGDRERLLAFHDDEQPVAIQLAGVRARERSVWRRRSPPTTATTRSTSTSAARPIACSRARFGACLMREPALVGDLVAAAKAAVSVPVTVKCRLGVDEQDPDAALGALADAVIAAGVDAIWVHARKAWLTGLSPKENREVPPLDYGQVAALKRALPGRSSASTAASRTLDQAEAVLADVDGVMLGRAACHTPSILLDVDRRFYGEPG